MTAHKTGTREEWLAARPVHAVSQWRRHDEYDRQ
jgi:hypothetical protein